MRAELRTQAEIPSGLVVFAIGRPLMVVRAYGTDPAAPVVLEELADVGPALTGQFALWSVEAVTRAAAAGPEPRSHDAASSRQGAAAASRQTWSPCYPTWAST